MQEHDILAFLLGVALLLGVARFLGELGRSLHLPLVAGEITTGLLLGATGLERLWPEAYAWLFPPGAPAAMLSGYTTIAVVLLLVLAGLEVDLNIVKRRGKSAMVVAMLGIVVPLAAGFVLGQVAPESAIGPAANRSLFAVFLGVALAISALPVVAKTLLDLSLFKTDVGLLVMTVAMIDDLFGWVGFSLLLGPLRGSGFDLLVLARTLLLALAFAFVCLVPGRRFIDGMLARLEQHGDVAPGRVLSLVAVLAMLGAGLTHAIGIHAVLGGFLVGIAVGDSPRLRERTRQTVHMFVTNVFAPVFFASVALRVDFLENFDLSLSVAVFAVATIAKLAGCAGGARLSGLPWRQSLAAGFGLNARGAMEIILALLAREAGLIDDSMFVALVAMAIGTSLLAGPTMKRLLYGVFRGVSSEDAAGLVRDGAFVPALASSTPARAIEELGYALRPVLGDLVEPALIAVLERELVAPTGLGDEVAIPHASVEGLARPVVALGLSPNGIDFGAPDGRPAKIVFLLLLPPKAYDREVRVLAALARAIFDEPARQALLAAKSTEEAVRVLDEHSRRIASQELAPRAASLAEA